MVFNLTGFWINHPDVKRHTPDQGIIWPSGIGMLFHLRLVMINILDAGTAFQVSVRLWLGGIFGQRVNLNAEGRAFV